MSQISNLKHKRYQVVFFDLDGTLIDPKEGISKSIQFALGKMNIPAPTMDELEWCIGPSLRESFARLTNSSCDRVVNDALRHYRQRYSEVGLYENLLYPGVEGMLEKLQQQGYRLFVATSKPQIFAVQILNHFGLDRYFEKIYGSELDGTRSDKGELLEYILEDASLHCPSVMVGDRKFDVIAALRNRVDPLGVSYGYGSREELIDAGAHHLCHSPIEVYQWISS